jgi:hypothetical protein
MDVNLLSSCRSALVLVPVAFYASRSKSLSIGTCARLSSMFGLALAGLYGVDENCTFGESFFWAA